LITSGFIFFVVSSPLLDRETMERFHWLKTKINVLKNVFKTRPIVKRFSKTIENIGGVSEKNFLFEQWILKFHKVKSQNYNQRGLARLALSYSEAFFLRH